MKLMKIQHFLSGCLFLLMLATAFAQQASPGVVPQKAVTAPSEPPALTKFDLDFPGGTPKEFLKAVEKQYKVSWSSVADIPDEIQSVHIPALRMNRESLEPILRRGRRPGGFGGRSSGGFGGGFSALGTNDMGVAAAPSLTEQRQIGRAHV